MKTFLARYCLRNGSRGTLHLIAASSCDAVMNTIDLFGEQLRTCSVKPA